MNPMNQALMAGVAGAGRGAAVAGASLTQHVANQSPAQSPSALRNSVSRLEEMGAALHGMLGDLENRLDAILTPVPPPVATPTNETPAREGRSHVAERLSELENVMLCGLQRIAYLAGRVEL